MKITFLGTGTSQGIPVIGSDHPVCLSNDSKDKRLRASVLVSWSNYVYCIDCGPDFRQQMLAQRVNRLDGILFTHEHADHTMGLDDIRPFYYKQGAIAVYAHERVLDALQKRFAYIFSDINKYPGAPSVVPNVVDGMPFKIGNLEVTPIDALHHDLQVFGYRFKDFAYLTDIKTISNSETEKLHKLEVLVINALRIAPHISHFNLEEALRFIQKIKPKVAYITHISHHLGFHKEVESALPATVFLAYDGLEIEI